MVQVSNLLVSITSPQSYFLHTLTRCGSNFEMNLLTEFMFEAWHKIVYQTIVEIN